MRDDPVGINRHEREEAEAVRRLEEAGIGFIPPAVDFAARMWTGDWTENLVPEITPTESGWTFIYEGTWLCTDQALYYEVTHDGVWVADVSHVAGPFFFMRLPEDRGLYCRLDMPEGEIVETARFDLSEDPWPAWEVYRDSDLSKEEREFEQGWDL